MPQYHSRRYYHTQQYRQNVARRNYVQYRQQMDVDQQRYRQEMRNAQNAPPETFTETVTRRYYEETPAMQYLYQHADKRASNLLKVGAKGGIPEKDMQSIFEMAYKTLDKQEKLDFSVQFTDWESMPIDERNDYLGFHEYFEALPKEKQEGLISDYTKTAEFKTFLGSPEGGSQHMALMQSEAEKKFPLTPFLARATFPVTYPDLFNEKAKGMLSGNMLHQTDMYDSLGPQTRLFYSFGEAAVRAVSFPITLPQMAVKYVTGKGDLLDPLGRIATGKTLFLPDVANELERRRISPTQGAVESTIGYGLSWFDKQKGENTSYLDTVKKYPAESVFAAVGELSGLYLGGKAVKIAKAGAVKGLGGLKSSFEKIAKIEIPVSYEKWTVFKSRVSPTNWATRGVMRLTHVKKPTEQFFAADVRGGASFSTIEGGWKAMIDLFESKRNPLTGKIDVTHGTNRPVRTMLRDRPSGLLFDQKGDLLLMSHDNLSTLLTPGGGKGLFELGRSALKREVKEELGIRLKNIEYQFKFADYPSGNLYRFWSADFKGSPKMLGETTKIKFVDPLKVGSFDTAWHVDMAVSRLFGKHIDMPIIGNTRKVMNWYPDEFVTGVGEGGHSVRGGLYIVPEGYQPLFPFGLTPDLSSLLSESKGLSLFSRNRPAIIKSQIDEVIRLPEDVRFDVGKADAFLKYSHKADTGTIFEGPGGPSDFYTNIKAYITPKTEGFPNIHHSAEVEALLPSSVGMRKTINLMGENLKSFSDKWYDTWAKVTGYRDYTLAPRYKVPIPIRTYDPFVIPKDTIGIPKGVVTSDEFANTVKRAEQDLYDLYSGKQYTPVFSYEVAGRPMLSGILSSSRKTTLSSSKKSILSERPVRQSRDYLSEKIDYGYKIPYEKPYYEPPGQTEKYPVRYNDDNRYNPVVEYQPPAKPSYYIKKTQERYPPPPPPDYEIHITDRYRPPPPPDRDIYHITSYDYPPPPPPPGYDINYSSRYDFSSSLKSIKIPIIDEFSDKKKKKPPRSRIIHEEIIKFREIKIPDPFEGLGSGL